MSSGFWILLNCQKKTCVSIFLVVCISKSQNIKKSERPSSWIAELWRCIRDPFVAPNGWVGHQQPLNEGHSIIPARSQRSARKITMKFSRWSRFPLPQPTISNEYMFEEFLGCGFCWRCLILILPCSEYLHNTSPFSDRFLICDCWYQILPFFMWNQCIQKGGPTRNLCFFPVWNPAEWCPSLPSGTVPGVLRCLPSAMLPWWLWNP